MKIEFSCYPPREMLIELAKMGKQGREKYLWFGLYMGNARRKSKIRISVKDET